MVQYGTRPTGCQNRIGPEGMPQSRNRFRIDLPLEPPVLSIPLDRAIDGKGKVARSCQCFLGIDREKMSCAANMAKAYISNDFAQALLVAPRMLKTKNDITTARQTLRLYEMRVPVSPAAVGNQNQRITTRLFRKVDLDGDASCFTTRVFEFGKFDGRNPQ